MEKARIERTFSIGDALAMRPLRKIPAGILLPLAELVLGNRGFRHLRMATRTLPWTRKPLKRLDLNFYIMIVPTLCVTLALALRSRESPGSLLRKLYRHERGRKVGLLSTMSVVSLYHQVRPDTGPLPHATLYSHQVQGSVLP